MDFIVPLDFGCGSGLRVPRGSTFARCCKQQTASKGGGSVSKRKVELYQTSDESFRDEGLQRSKGTKPACQRRSARTRNARTTTRR